MRKLIKLLAIRLLIVIAAFCALRYLAGFSDTQSVALAIAVWLLWRPWFRQPEPLPFEPYSLSVRPNLHATLTDFELVKPTDEDWAKLRAGIEQVPKKPWNIWEYPELWVSFITAQLIYENYWSRFATEVDVNASLRPIGIQDRHPVVSQRNYDEEPFQLGVFEPSLGLKTGRGGFSLSIRLPDWYWETLRDKQIFKGIAREDVRSEPMCGSVEVPLAVIPFEEFIVYQPQRPEVDYEAKKAAYELAIKRRAAARHYVTNIRHWKN
jgi:hypothetical protein